MLRLRERCNYVDSIVTRSRFLNIKKLIETVDTSSTINILCWSEREAFYDLWKFNLNIAPLMTRETERNLKLRSYLLTARNPSRYVTKATCVTRVNQSYAARGEYPAENIIRADMPPRDVSRIPYARRERNFAKLLNKCKHLCACIAARYSRAAYSLAPDSAYDGESRIRERRRATTGRGASSLRSKSLSRSADALFIRRETSRRARLLEEISDSPDGSVDGWEQGTRGGSEGSGAPPGGTARHGVAKFHPPSADRQADTGDGWDANETRNDRLLPPGQEPPSRAWNGFPLPGSGPRATPLRRALTGVHETHLYFRH